MEEFIKKIKEIKLPNSELRIHKQLLRNSLLDLYNKKEKPYLFWRISFVGGFLLIMFLISFLIIQPNLIKAEAMKIAKRDPQIKKMIQEGMLPSEIKIYNRRAYLLFVKDTQAKWRNSRSLEVGVNKSRYTISENENLNPDIIGMVAEIDMTHKKVNSFRFIKREDVFPIDNQEKKEIEKIIKEEKLIREIFPNDLEIERIEPIVPQRLRLINLDKGVKVVPDTKNQEKRVGVKVKIDHKKWLVEVNLNNRRVERLQLISDKAP